MNVFFIALSALFEYQMYVKGLRPLEIFSLLQCGDRF